MDLFLKFLILGGKYLSQLTAQSIVEAYRRSIQLSRSLNHHCSKSVSVVTNYDNVLEMYNRNLEDLQVTNPHAHLAFISDQHRQEFVSYMNEAQLLTDETVNDLLSEPPCINVGGSASDDKVSYVRQMALSIINSSKNTADSLPAMVPLADTCQSYADRVEVVELPPEETTPRIVSNIKISSDFAKTENMKSFRGRPSLAINYYCEKASELDEKSTVINHVAEFLDRQSEYIKCANDTFKQLQLDISLKYHQMRQQQLQKLEQEDQHDLDFVQKLKAVQTEVEHCTKLMKCVQDHFDVHEEDIKTKRLFSSVDKIIKDVEEITILMNTNDDHFRGFESFESMKKKGVPSEEASNLLDVNLSAYNKLLCSMVNQQLSNNQPYSTAASTSSMIPIEGYINGFLSKFRSRETEKIMDVNQKVFDEHEQKLKYPLIGRWNNRIKRSRTRSIREKIKHRFNNQKHHGPSKKSCKGSKMHAVRRSQFVEIPLHRISEDPVSPNYAALSSSWIKDDDKILENWEDFAEEAEKKPSMPMQMINIQSAIERFLPKKSGEKSIRNRRGRKSHNIVLVDEKLDNLVDQLMHEMDDDVPSSSCNKNFSSSPPQVSRPSKAKLISDIKKDIRTKVQNIPKTTTSEIEDPMAYHLVAIEDSGTAEYDNEYEQSEVFFQATSPVVDATDMYQSNREAEEFDDDYAKILAELAETDAHSIDGEKVGTAKRVSRNSTEASQAHYPHVSAVRVDAIEGESAKMKPIRRIDNDKIQQCPKRQDANIENAPMETSMIENFRKEVGKLDASKNERESVKTNFKNKIDSSRAISTKMDAIRKGTARKDAARFARHQADAAEAEKARLEAVKCEAARLEAARIEAAKVEAVKNAKAAAAKTEAARVEAARVLAAKAEAAQAEAIKAETAKAEAAKAKAARIAAARIEAARVESEKAEVARLEAKRKEIAHYEAIRREAGKVQAIKIEAEKNEARKKEMAKIEAGRAEAIRSEVSLMEARKAEALAKREVAKMEAAKVEEAKREVVAKMEAAKAEAAKIEALKKEKVRIEAEKQEAARIEAAKAEAAKSEAKRLELAKIEAARLEAAKVEAARLEAKQRQIERIEAAKIEAAKLQAAKFEAAKLENAKYEAARMESRRMEGASIDAAKAEAARIKARKAECAKIEAARMKAVKKQVARSEAFKMTCKKVDVTKIEAAKKEAVKAMAARAEAARLVMIKAEKEKAEAAKNEAKKVEMAKMKIARMEAAKAMSAMAEAARLEARQKEISKIEAVKAEAARNVAARREQTRSQPFARFEADDEDEEANTSMHDETQEESSELDVPVLKTALKPSHIKMEGAKLMRPTETEKKLFVIRGEAENAETEENAFATVEDEAKLDKAKEIRDNAYGKVIKPININRQTSKIEALRTTTPNLEIGKGQALRPKTLIQPGKLSYFKTSTSQAEKSKADTVQQAPVSSEEYKRNFAKSAMPKINSGNNSPNVKSGNEKNTFEKMDFIQEATAKLSTATVDVAKKEPSHLQTIVEGKDDEVARICSEIKFEHANHTPIDTTMDMAAASRRSSCKDNGDVKQIIDVHTLMNDVDAEINEKQILLAWEENNKLLELAREMNLRALKLKSNLHQETTAAKTMDTHYETIARSEENIDEEDAESAKSMLPTEKPTLEQKVEVAPPLLRVQDNANEKETNEKHGESKVGSNMQWIDSIVNKENSLAYQTPKHARQRKRKPKHDDEHKFFKRWNLAKNFNARRRKVSKPNSVVRTNSSEITLVDMINGGTRLLESSKTSTRHLSFSKGSINFDLLRKPSDHLEIERSKRNKSRDIKLIPMKLLQRAIKGKEQIRNKESTMKVKNVEQTKESMEMNKYRAASAKRLRKPPPPAPEQESSENVEEKEEKKSIHSKSSVPFSTAAMSLEKIVGASSNKIIPKKIYRKEINMAPPKPEDPLSKIDEQPEAHQQPIKSMTPVSTRGKDKPKKPANAHQQALTEMSNDLREYSNKVDSEALELKSSKCHEPTYAEVDNDLEEYRSKVDAEAQELKESSSQMKQDMDEQSVKDMSKINVNKVMHDEQTEAHNYADNLGLNTSNQENQDNQENQGKQGNQRNKNNRSNQVNSGPDIVKMSTASKTTEEEAFVEDPNMKTYHQVYENLKELCAQNMPVQNISSTISESETNEALLMNSSEHQETISTPGLKVIQDTDDNVQSIQLNDEKLGEIKSKNIVENDDSVSLRSTEQAKNEDTVTKDSTGSKGYELNLVQIIPEHDEAIKKPTIYTIKDKKADIKIKTPQLKASNKCNLNCMIKYDDPMVGSPQIKTLNKELKESIEYYHMFNTEECIKRGHMANKILMEYDNENSPQEQFFVKPPGSAKKQQEPDNISTYSAEADDSGRYSGDGKKRMVQELEDDDISIYKSEKSIRLADEAPKTRKSDQGMLPQKHLESDSIRTNKRSTVNALQTRKQSSVCEPQHENSTESKTRAFIEDFKAKVKAIGTGAAAEVENQNISVQNEPIITLNSIISPPENNDPQTEPCSISKLETCSSKEPATDSKRYQVSINFDIVDKDIQMKENIQEQPPVRESESVNTPSLRPISNATVLSPTTDIEKINEDVLSSTTDMHKKINVEAPKVQDNAPQKTFAEFIAEIKLPEVEVPGECKAEVVENTCKLESKPGVEEPCKLKDELIQSTTNKAGDEPVESKSCKDNNIDENKEALSPVGEKPNVTGQETPSSPVSTPMQQVVKMDEETKEHFKRKVMAVNSSKIATSTDAAALSGPPQVSKVSEPVIKLKPSSVDPARATAYTDMRKHLVFPDARRPPKYQYQRSQNDDYKSSGKSVRDLNKLSSMKLAAGPPKYRFSLKPTKKTELHMLVKKQATDTAEVAQSEDNQEKGDAVQLDTSLECKPEPSIEIKAETVEENKSVVTSGDIKTEAKQEIRTESETAPNDAKDTISASLPENETSPNTGNRSESVSGSKPLNRFGARVDNAQVYRGAKPESKSASRTGGRSENQLTENITSIRPGSRLPYQTTSKTNMAKTKSYGRSAENKTVFRPQSKRTTSRYESKSANRPSTRLEYKPETMSEVKMETKAENQVTPSHSRPAVVPANNIEATETNDTNTSKALVKSNDVSVALVADNTNALMQQHKTETDQDKSSKNYPVANVKLHAYIENGTDQKSEQTCDSFETQIEFQRQSFVRNGDNQRPQFESYKSFDYSFQKGEGLRSKPYHRSIGDEFAKVVKASKLPRSTTLISDIAKSSNNESVEPQRNGVGPPRSSLETEGEIPPITANLVNPIQTNIVDMTSITCVQYLNKLSYNIDNSAYSSLIEIFKDPLKTAMPTKPDLSRSVQVIPSNSNVTPVNRKPQETFFVNAPPSSKSTIRRSEAKPNENKTGQEVFIYVDSTQNANQPSVKTLSKSVLHNLRQRTKNSLKKNDSSGSFDKVSSVKRLPDFMQHQTNNRNLKRMILMDDKIKKLDVKGRKKLDKNVAAPLDKTLENVLEDFYAKKSSKYPGSSFRPITTPAFSDKSRTAGTHYRKSYSNINSSDSKSTHKLPFKEMLHVAPMKGNKSENIFKQSIEDVKAATLDQIQLGAEKKALAQTPEASNFKTPPSKKIELMTTKPDSMPGQMPELKLPLSRIKNKLPNIPELKNVQIVIPKTEIFPSPGDKSSSKRKLGKENKSHQSSMMKRAHSQVKINAKSKKVEPLRTLASIPTTQQAATVQKPKFNKMSNVLNQERGKSSSDPKASMFLKTLQNKVQEHIQEHLIRKKQEKDREKKFLPRCDIRTYTNDFGKQLASLKAQSERERESLYDKAEYQRQLVQHLQGLSALPKATEKQLESSSTVVYKPPAERGIREVTKPSLSDMKRTIMKHLRITTTPSRPHVERQGSSTGENYLLRQMSSSTIQKRKYILSHGLKAVSSESGNEEDTDDFVVI